MRQWFVVKTKPRQEVQTSAVLVQRGIEVYLPEVPTRRRPDRRVTALEPLFPGYLFARLAFATAEWVAARSAPGVAYFLGQAGIPSPVPDDLVEHIRDRVEARRAQGWQPSFKRGDRVVIEGGPFAGLEAIFDSTLSASGRVRVLLETIGRLTPIDLHAGYLRRAG